MLYGLLLLFGVAVGILSGLLGIGGGIALVPGLMLLFGFSQPEAQGTSLAVLIPPIGLFAALVYYEHGYVRLPVVGWIALGIMLGALIGAKLVPHIPPAALRILFGLLLLYLGFSFVLQPVSAKPTAALPAGLAAMISFLAAIGLRSRRANRRKRPPSPGDDVEYHI
ncbi:MAG: TSUP family transporter [Planctomycetaceae bacterium]